MRRDRIRQKGARTITIAVLLGLAGCQLLAPGSDAGAPELRASAITELRPFEAGSVRPRMIELRLETAGIAVCGTTSYGFLIDSDRNDATGLTISWHQLGADARISITCDSGNGRWSSSVGSLSLSQKEARSIFQIRAAVADLPAVDFHWVAYELDGDNLSLLPLPPSTTESGRTGHVRWTILERAMH